MRSNTWGGGKTMRVLLEAADGQPVRELEIPHRERPDVVVWNTRTFYLSLFGDVIVYREARVYFVPDGGVGLVRPAEPFRDEHRGPPGKYGDRSVPPRFRLGPPARPERE